ncbi:MAG TPA: small ribosomal subunit Rsm22 family protein [Planctomycetota bacterium]
MPRHFARHELDLLRVLREGFLEHEQRPGGGAPPYWGSEDELALYDETFGARIGWKWDAVLDELAARARLPAGRTVLDWGCGSGIAARRYLARTPGVERVVLWDHSHAARAFAAERVQAEFPAVAVETELTGAAPDVLLVSHVLGELALEGREPLLEAARSAGAVLWVEPGSRASSRALGAMREALRATHAVLAPCPHQERCGALTGDAWCHFFARPAPEAFTTGPWGELSRELGIDLRSLPYSFLVLARRAAELPASPSVRLLGRPRLTRGRAQLTICRAEGVEEVDFLQRTDKRLFKELEDVAGTPWIFAATIEDGRITRLERDI